MDYSSCLVDDVWIGILGQIDAPALCAIAQTCVYFSKLSDDKFLWGALLAQKRKAVMLVPAGVPYSPKDLYRHRKDFDSITEAIQEASTTARDTIYVAPGKYPESLILEKAVDIIGEGHIGGVQIEGPGGNTVTSRTENVLLQNLVLTQSGHWFCVEIEMGCINVIKCHIRNSGLSAIKIGKDANPVIAECVISDCNEAGIAIFGGGGLIENNEFRGNRYGSIEVVYDTAFPTIRGNSIHHNIGYGIHIHSSATACIDSNTIHSNETDGMSCWGSANPTVTRNKIYGNKGDGIYIHEKGSGTYTENEIYNQRLDGIRLSACSPTISNNSIHHNEGDGVRLIMGANPQIKENQIFENARVGVHVYRESKGHLEGNTVYSNKNAGIQIYGSSYTRVLANRILGNRCSGLYVSDGAIVEVRANDVAYNGDSGIEIVSGSRTRCFQANKVHHNEAAGTVFYPDTKPALLEAANEIHDNGTSKSPRKRPSSPSESDSDVEMTEAPIGRKSTDVVQKEGREMYLQPIKKGAADEAVSFLVEKAIVANKCTLAFTKEYYHAQYWYECRTCSQTRVILGKLELSICEVCAKNCHKGHELSLRKFGHFYCDCGKKPAKGTKPMCVCIDH